MKKTKEQIAAERTAFLKERCGVIERVEDTDEYKAADRAGNEMEKARLVLRAQLQKPMRVSAG